MIHARITGRSVVADNAVAWSADPLNELGRNASACDFAGPHVIVVHGHDPAARGGDRPCPLPGRVYGHDIGVRQQQVGGERYLGGSSLAARRPPAVSLSRLPVRRWRQPEAGKLSRAATPLAAPAAIPCRR